jgi:imidazolonepropionase-like amidohydrolase
MTRRILAIAFCASAALAPACSPPREADLVVSDVTIYDGENEAPFMATVAVKDGKFVAIDREANGTYRTDTIVDGAGLYMTPGLWDMHAHVADSADKKPDLAAFVEHGVTSIRDAGGIPEKLAAAKAAVARGESGPTIYAVGPTLNGESFGPFQRVVTSEADVRAAVDELASAGAAMIKIHRAFRPELLPVLIEAAHARGLQVFGHIPLGVSPLEACELDMDGIEHLGSFLEALNSVAPEDAPKTASFDYMESDEAAPLYACLASRQVEVAPTLVVYPAVARRRLGDQPMPPEFFEFIERTQGIALRLHRAGVPLLAGSDTALTGEMELAPGVSLLDELEMLQDAGIPPRAIIPIATSNAAKTLGVFERTGSIAVGKDADFLLLEADPGADAANFRKLRAVYKAGSPVERR